MPLDGTDDLKRLKASVKKLFSDGGLKNANAKKHEPTDHAFDALFTKETFVLSEEDLKMINGDLNKQMAIEGFKELVSDDVYPETGGKYDGFNGHDDDNMDKYSGNYYDGSENVYEGDYDNSDLLDDEVSERKVDDIGVSSDTDFSDFEKHEYENYTENYDKRANKLLPDNLTKPIARPPKINELGSNGDTILESDTELDNTHYLYDPPLKYKEKFLMYMLKSSPFIIIGLLLLFILGLAAEDSLASFNSINPFTPTSSLSLNPFFSHKMYLLEEDVKSLKKLEKFGDQLKVFEIEFQNIKDHISKLEYAVSASSNSESSNDVVNPLFDKLNQLEQKVDILSKKLNQEISDKSILKEMKGQLAKYSDLAQFENKNHVLNSKLHKISTKFFNIANKCHVVRQLTSYPPLSQYKKEERRKSIQSRIIHGFPDFMKRMLNPNKGLSSFNKVRTLANIKLLSSANSPRNVLSENPTLFWQNVASAMPIYLTIQAPTPIRVHELGIYHSRLPPNFHLLDDITKADIRKRWFNTAPKNVEFLVRPIPAEQEPMKESMGLFYNQDLKFNVSRKVKADNLAGWVRVGELSYDINSNRAYQPLIWNAEVKREITKWNISDFMLVIHSNWGDEIVVLDALRVFQLDDGQSKEYNGNLIEANSFQDSTDIAEFTEDNVIYLGEEEHPPL